MTTMTPYAAAKIVNAALLEHGLDIQIPPQMMYNYARKGYIQTVEVDGRNQIVLEGEKGLSEWLQKYLTKKGVKFEDETEETEETVELSPEEVVMGVAE